MVKRSIKPLAASALFTLALASGAAQAVAQQQGRIVYQQQAYEAPGYCHIKYKAFTNESLQTGQLEFDEDNLIDRYGAWGEKTAMGRTYMGILRSTFLIDPDGKIVRTWPKVKADGHAAEVLEALGEERAARPS